MNRIIFAFLILAGCCQIQGMQLAQRYRPKRVIPEVITGRVEGTQGINHEPYIEYSRRVRGEPEYVYVSYSPHTGRYKVEGELVPSQDESGPREPVQMTQEQMRDFYNQVAAEHAENEVRETAQGMKLMRLE